MRIRRRSSLGSGHGASGGMHLKEELRKNMAHTWATLAAPTNGTGEAVGFNGLPVDNLENKLDQVTDIRRNGSLSQGDIGTGSGTGSGEYNINVARSDRTTIGTIGKAKQISGTSTELSSKGIGTVGDGIDIGKVDIVAQGTPSGDGIAPVYTRTDAEVLRVVHEQVNVLKYQYQQILKLNPNLKGVLKVKLSIQPNGHVQSVDLIQDTIGNTRFSRTIRTMIRGWRFTTVSSGISRVTLTLPFSPL
jgi:hypothetical protein